MFFLGSTDLVHQVGHEQLRSEGAVGINDEAIVSMLADLVITKRRSVAAKKTVPRARRAPRLKLEYLEPREVPAVVAATSEPATSEDASSEVLQASQMSAFFEQS